MLRRGPGGAQSLVLRFEQLPDVAEFPALLAAPAWEILSFPQAEVDGSYGVCPAPIAGSFGARGQLDAGSFLSVTHLVPVLTHCSASLDAILTQDNKVAARGIVTHLAGGLGWPLVGSVRDEGCPEATARLDVGDRGFEPELAVGNVLAFGLGHRSRRAAAQPVHRVAAAGSTPTCATRLSSTGGPRWMVARGLAPVTPCVARCYEVVVK